MTTDAVNDFEDRIRIMLGNNIINALKRLNRLLNGIPTFFPFTMRRVEKTTNNALVFKDTINYKSFSVNILTYKPFSFRV